jgi:hypothetical protein
MKETGERFPWRRQMYIWILSLMLCDLCPVVAFSAWSSAFVADVGWDQCISAGGRCLLDACWMNVPCLSLLLYNFVYSTAHVPCLWEGQSTWPGLAGLTIVAECSMFSPSGPRLRGPGICSLQGWFLCHIPYSNSRHQVTGRHPGLCLICSLL